MIDLACITVAHVAPLARPFLARWWHERGRGAVRVSADPTRRRRAWLQLDLSRKRGTASFDDAARRWGFDRD